jgi:hypothetical protein
MKILIDECVPAELKGPLNALGHECQTVREAGLAAKKNGGLLALSEGRWNVLLTTDRNIKYQQNLAGRNIRHPGPLREIESGEGIVAVDVCVCSSATVNQGGRDSGSRNLIVRFLITA